MIHRLAADNEHSTPFCPHKAAKTLTHTHTHVQEKMKEEEVRALFGCLNNPFLSRSKCMCSDKDEGRNSPDGPSCCLERSRPPTRGCSCPPLPDGEEEDGSQRTGETQHGRAQMTGFKAAALRAGAAQTGQNLPKLLGFRIQLQAFKIKHSSFTSGSTLLLLTDNWIEI